MAQQRVTFTDDELRKIIELKDPDAVDLLNKEELDRLDTLLGDPTPRPQPAPTAPEPVAAPQTPGPPTLEDPFFSSGPAGTMVNTPRMWHEVKQFFGFEPDIEGRMRQMGREVKPPSEQSEAERKFQAMVALQEQFTADERNINFELTGLPAFSRLGHKMLNPAMAIRQFQDNPLWATFETGTDAIELVPGLGVIGIVGDMRRLARGMEPTALGQAAVSTSQTIEDVANATATAAAKNAVGTAKATTLPVAAAQVVRKLRPGKVDADNLASIAQTGGVRQGREALRQQQAQYVNPLSSKPRPAAEVLEVSDPDAVRIVQTRFEGPGTPARYEVIFKDIYRLTEDVDDMVAGTHVKVVGDDFDSLAVVKPNGEVANIPANVATPGRMALQDALASQDQIFNPKVKLGREIDFRDQVLRYSDDLDRPMASGELGTVVRDPELTFPNQVKQAQRVFERFPTARYAAQRNMLNLKPWFQDWVSVMERPVSGLREVVALPSKMFDATGTWQFVRGMSRLHKSFVGREMANLQSVFTNTPMANRSARRSAFTDLILAGDDKAIAKKAADMGDQVPFGKADNLRGRMRERMVSGETPATRAWSTQEIRDAQRLRRMFDDMQDLAAQSADSKLTFEQYAEGFVPRRRFGGTTGTRVTKGAEDLPARFEQQRTAQSPEGLQDDAYVLTRNYIDEVGSRLYLRPAEDAATQAARQARAGFKLGRASLVRHADDLMKKRSGAGVTKPGTKIQWAPKNKAVEKYFENPATGSGRPTVRPGDEMRLVEVDPVRGIIRAELDKTGKTVHLSKDPKNFTRISQSLQVAPLREFADSMDNWVSRTLYGTRREPGAVVRSLSKLPGVNGAALERLITGAVYMKYLGASIPFLVKNMSFQGSVMPIAQFGVDGWGDAVARLARLDDADVEFLRTLNLGIDAYQPFDLVRIGDETVPIIGEGMGSKAAKTIMSLVWWSDTYNRAVGGLAAAKYYDDVIRAGGKANTPSRATNTIIERNAARINRLAKTDPEKAALAHLENKRLFADETIGRTNWWYERINDPGAFKNGSPLIRTFAKWPVNFAHFVTSGVGRVGNELKNTARTTKGVVAREVPLNAMWDKDQNTAMAQMFRYIAASYAMSQLADEAFDIDITDWFLLGPMPTEIPFGVELMQNIAQATVGAGQGAFEQAVGRQSQFRDATRSEALKAVQDLFDPRTATIYRNYRKAQEAGSIVPFVTGKVPEKGGGPFR